MSSSLVYVPTHLPRGPHSMSQTQLDLLWGKMLSIVEAQISKASFDTWFKPTKALALRNGLLYIEVPSEYAKDWLEERYMIVLQEALSSIIDEAPSVRLVLPGNGVSLDASDKAARQQPRVPDVGNALLNPKYTFSTFVVGDSNRFAHAAALAASEAPGRAYNPLFVYGGVGLGKTHLMQAIGHFTIEQSSAGVEVVYLSSEKFTNEMINSIRDSKMEEFRERYRSVDVLLIDDIQFLAGRERTQEEFFHTFNALHESNKQIVISSDRPPKEIPTLEDRLRSRFGWGLIVDIKLPDLETRVAILKKKANVEGIPIMDDVLLYIATQVQSNIRELEGALVRVEAYARLEQRPVTVDFVAEALKDMISVKRPTVLTIDRIQNLVAKHYSLKPEELKAKKRTQAVAFPRQIAMYICRELTDYSLPKIGEEFGGRDHTTVMHAYDRVSRALDESPQVAEVIRNMMEKLKAE